MSTGPRPSDVLRRLVAVLVAVALVVIALVIRNGVDRGGGSTKLNLVCTPELESICDSLGSHVAVTIENPGITADRLEKSGANGMDGWLTPGPWTDLVQQARIRAGNPALLSPSPIL